jgi:hypothetical protein
MSLGRAVCKTTPRDAEWSDVCKWDATDLIPYDPI